jgi:hypothetical protein
MPHGGKRTGAGREKGGVASHTLQAQELRKRLIEAAKENWEAIIFTTKQLQATQSPLENCFTAYLENQSRLLQAQTTTAISCRSK